MKAYTTLLIFTLITSVSSAQIPKAATETPAMPENPPQTWLTYHLPHPEPGHATPGDPNPAFFWKGRFPRLDPLQAQTLHQAQVKKPVPLWGLRSWNSGIGLREQGHQAILPTNG